MPRVAVVLLGALILSGCDSPSGRPTPGRLIATVTPSPLEAPLAVGSDIMWNLELRALGSGDILIERSEATLLDAAGVVAGRAEEYWSRSAGCSVCSTEVRVAENRTMNWSNRWIRYTRGGVPVAFVYTLWYVDDLGPGTTTVTVPVR